jgi:hypothetical protein
MAPFDSEVRKVLDRTPPGGHLEFDFRGAPVVLPAEANSVEIAKSLFRHAPVGSTGTPSIGFLGQFRGTVTYPSDQD